MEHVYSLYSLGGEILMCSVGDAFSVDMADSLDTKSYKCKDCGNEFQGMGKRIICPTCQSKNVEMA
ncbi:MAG: hydrogenase maturation nickel metallochaperone HypA [ANME-2 cluster archaeon]|jgi:Zn finger protein HypA/HybF involved in hydrogenase expression|nr:hydrogenase maturation nickel metallochaperone HypA [ANME-2 cluster archaeon]